MASEPAIVLSDDSDREVEEISGGPTRQRVSLSLCVSALLRKTRPEAKIVHAFRRSSRGALEAKDPPVLQAFVKVRLKAVTLMLFPSRCLAMALNLVLNAHHRNKEAHPKYCPS